MLTRESRLDEHLFPTAYNPMVYFGLLIRRSRNGRLLSSSTDNMNDPIR